jgi:basic membrane protein A and related proteins
MKTAMPLVNRRLALSLIGAAAISRRVLANEPVRIAALFAGRIDDGGFMQAGYGGLKLAEQRLGAKISFVQEIPPQLEPLSKALRQLAAEKPDVVIAHGGQNNAAAKLVAAELPDTRFVVTQGNVTGPNLASYEVLQELSAYLAGVLAALLTKTGVVAHLSGIKFASTLKARAAYANGITETNPKVRLLTGFTGSMDDGALAKRATIAMAEAGADIVFTMLNAARNGAIEGCREKRIQQIGNVVDWTTRVPDVFIGSAIADAGLAVFSAGREIVDGSFKPGIVRPIGLEDPEAVRLALSTRIPDELRARIITESLDVFSDPTSVPTEWTGPEFALPK